MTKRHYRVSEWTVCVCAPVCVPRRKMQVTFYRLPSSSYCSRYKFYLDLFKQSQLRCCSVGCFSSSVQPKVFHMWNTKNNEPCCFFHWLTLPTLFSHRAPLCKVHFSQMWSHEGSIQLWLIFCLCCLLQFTWCNYSMTNMIKGHSECFPEY